MESAPDETILGDVPRVRLVLLANLVASPRLISHGVASGLVLPDGILPGAVRIPSDGFWLDSELAGSHRVNPPRCRQLFGLLK
jgi:hypothetical protein